MSKRAKAELNFVLPDGVSLTEARDYIVSALMTERGFLRPENPMSEFNADDLDINVKWENTNV